MAKISINEKDLSWYYRQRQRGDLTVYIPGLSSFGPYEPTYVTDTSFPTLFGSPLNVKNDYSFYLAKSLLKTGASILFHRIPLPGAAQAVAKSEVSYAESGDKNKYVSLGVTKFAITNSYVTKYHVAITVTSAYILKVTNESDADVEIEANDNTYTIAPGENQFSFDTTEERQNLMTAIDNYEGSANISYESSGGVFSFTVDGTSYSVSHEEGEKTFDFPKEKKDTVDAALAAAVEGFDGTVEVNASEAPLSITVETKDSDGNVTDSFTQVFEDSTEPVLYKVDNKFKEAFEEAVAENKYLNIVEEESSASVSVKAKYAGEFGNSLSCSVQYASAGVRYFTIKVTNTQGTTYVTEYLTVNFADPMSPNYYENVDSMYLTFEVGGDFEKYDTDILTTGNLVFSDGTNFDKAEFNDRPRDGVKITDVVEEAVYVMANNDFFEPLKNPYGYYFDILTNGALVSDAEGSFDEATYSVDGEVIIPEGLNYTLDKVLVNIANTTKMSVYLIGGGRKSSMDSNAFKSYCGRFNTSFASGIGPWGFSQLLSEGSRVWLPGWYAQLVEWGLSIQKGNPLWYAPAGTQRARVGSVILRPDYEVDNTILDDWQNQDYTVSNIGSFKINPIMNLKQYGYCVYGNSTLLHSRFDGSTSMLQSLGTRVLVNRIKARAFDVALGLQFDQLSDNLFYRFKELMIDFMERLKAQDGLYDYQILLDRDSVTYADLNQRTIPVLIRISPNPAAENFDITCEVYPAGITFTDEFDETQVIG